MSIFPRFPHYANIDIGGGYWMSLPEAQRTDMFLEYMKEAKRILAEQQINASDVFIESAVEAAFRQFHVRVLAGIDEPNPDHWHNFFRKFVPNACHAQSLGLHCGDHVLDQIVDATPSKTRHSRRHGDSGVDGLKQNRQRHTTDDHGAWARRQTESA